MPRDLLQFLLDYSNLKKEQYSDSLNQIQEGRLEKILATASKTEKYRNILQDCSGGIRETLSKNKPTEKADVNANPRHYIGSPVGPLHEVRTSGSSGIPARVFIDDRTLVHRTAFRFLIESSYGRSPDELAVQVHDVLHPPSLMSRLGLFRKLFLSVFDSEEKNLAALRKSKARVLSGYASAIAIMAKLNNESKSPLQMKHVFCYGEAFGQETRKLIEDSFSCPVYQLYGSNEFGPIAYECPEERKLHVNSGAFLIELVDSKNKPSGSGEVLVTCLINQGMPLLRYRIGDRSRWGRCGCGRTWPVLESIEGRSDDFIVLPGPRLHSAFSLFCLYGIPGLKEYQVVQEEVDNFVFRHVPTGHALPNSSKKEIVEKIQRAALGNPIKIDFEQVKSVPRGRSGKRRSFVSKVVSRHGK